MSSGGGSAFTLTKNTADTGILTGANTYSGGTIVSGGTLQIGSGGTTGSLSTSSVISISSGATLAFDRSNAMFQGTDFTSTAISGAGILSQIGSGALVLSTANSYTGGTKISAGTLDINNATAIGTGALTISGGTIDNTSGGSISLTNNNAQTWSGSFAFGGSNALNLGTGAVTLSATPTIALYGANSLTVGGIIGSGSANGLTVVGTGTLVLSGASAYTGATSVNGGTLSLTGSLSSSSALSLGGGTLSYAPTGTGNTQTFNGFTVSAGESTATVSAGNILAIGALTTRTAGGAVNFSSTGTIDTNDTAGDGTGILGPWATYGGTSYRTPRSRHFWRARSRPTPAPPRRQRPATSLPPRRTTPFLPARQLGTASANTSTGNTLQFVGTAASSLTPASTGGLAANGILSANSGGTLINSGGGSLVIGTGTNKELMITGKPPLTINAVIAPNASGTSGLTYSGTGTLTLNGREHIHRTTDHQRRHCSPRTTSPPRPVLLRTQARALQ